MWGASRELPDSPGPSSPATTDGSLLFRYEVRRRKFDGDRLPGDPAAAWPERQDDHIFRRAAPTVDRSAQVIAIRDEVDGLEPIRVDAQWLAIHAGNEYDAFLTAL